MYTSTEVLTTSKRVSRLIPTLLSAARRLPAPGQRTLRLDLGLPPRLPALPRVSMSAVVTVCEYGV
jgi:hypothetical protein